MSVTLTDEQYGELMHALRKIARGRRDSGNGHPKRMSRDEMELIARDACDAFGWSYGGEVA